MLLANPLSEGLQNKRKHFLMLKMEHLSGIQFILLFFSIVKQFADNIPLQFRDFRKELARNLMNWDYHEEGHAQEKTCTDQLHLWRCSVFLIFTYNNESSPSPENEFSNSIETMFPFSFL